MTAFDTPAHALCSIPPSGWWCSRTAGHEGPCAARQCRYPVENLPHGVIKYGPWRLRYDPPPIPTNAFNWGCIHENFDASYEGPDDGWVGNGLCGAACTLADAIAECDEIEDDRTARGSKPVRVETGTGSIEDESRAEGLAHPSTPES